MIIFIQDNGRTRVTDFSPIPLHNLSPVRDALIANVYEDHIDSLYIASGTMTQSSVKELRHGVKCTLECRLELEETAKCLFSINNFLIISFLGGTRVMLLDRKNGILEDCTTEHSINPESTTIGAYPVESNPTYYWQVTPENVQICRESSNYKNGNLFASTQFTAPKWHADGTITCAALFYDALIVAVSDHLYTLKVLIYNDSVSIFEAGKIKLENEVCCIYCPDYDTVRSQYFS